MHGLLPQKKASSYFHFPFSYSRQVPLKSIAVLNEDQNEEEDVGEEVEEVPEDMQITKKLTHVQTFGVPMNIPSYNTPNMMNMPQFPYPVPYPPQENIIPETADETNFKQALEKTEQLPVKKTTIIKHEIHPIYPSGFPQPQTQFYPQMSESQPRQNWNWPGAQYFPIVIRDPFIQMYNAITTLIEYGPMGGGAGQASNCKSKVKEGRTPKIATTTEPSDSDEVIMDIEDIIIGGMEKETSRSNKIDNRYKNMLEKRNNLFKIPTSNATLVISSKNDTLSSPPDREPELNDDELDDEESDKSDDIVVSNDHTKKVFSKDNTGNGIFIHKIKVRKGGVAVAGPGGIATAGSGGTAIVGPNGFAYTHPDSLAIAGSGSKVISVDPSVSLMEALKNHNKTRMGKIVATGPVVFYNKG